MGFLDMFDNPDIMTSLLGINTAAGSPGAMPTAPVYQAPPNGGEMGEVFNQAPPAPPQSGTGLNVHDQLPPGQPAGPTMAGVRFPTPPAGSAAAAANPPLKLAPLPGPNGGFAGPVGPGAIPTSVGPIQAERIMQPPPSTYDGRPPTSTNGSLGAALGIQPRYEGSIPSPANPLISGRYGLPGGPDPRVGNAITAGLAGLGRGLTAVGQARPGASGAQMFAAGAGGALEGGSHQMNLQEAQARQAKIDAFNMSSNAFKDWIAARHADNEEDMTRFKGDYFRARARAFMTGGGGARGMQTPEQQAAFVEGAALRYRDQLRKGNEARIKNPELGKPYSDEELDQRVESYRKGLYKHFSMNPKEGAKLAEAGIDEKNPISLKGITTQEQFDQQVPENAHYDTGKKYDANGEYKFTRSDGTPDVRHGEPGAPVILQRMPSMPQPQQSPQPQSQNLEDSYLMGGGMETG